MANCINCSTGLRNSGLINGVKPQGEIFKLVFTPLVANDESLNRIDLTETLNKAFFDALINNTDKSKRWYPTPILENITDDREDAVFETFNSRRKVYKDKGLRGLTAEIPSRPGRGVPSAYLEVIRNMNCEKMGFYIVDDCGNLYGDFSNSAYLAPIPVMPATFDYKSITALGETVHKLMFGFTYDLKFDDSHLGMIYSQEIDGISLSDVEGLINLILDSSTLAGDDSYVDVTIKTDFGSAVGGLLVPNLAAKISVYLVSDDTEITNTVAETSTGVYRITPSSSFSADFYVGTATGVIGFDQTALNTTISVA